MKILIVAVFFPPQNSIASLRPYSWAKYWAQWGHDVTVLTTPKPFHPSNSPMPCDGFRVLEIPVPGIAMIRSRMGRANHDIQPSDVVSAPDKDSKSTTANPARRLLTAMQEHYGVFNLCRLPDKHDLWAWYALSHVSGEKWDAVVTTGWPYSVHFIGYRLKQSGLANRWGLDWRDLWTDNHIYPGLPVVRVLEGYLERLFHQKADVITTVSEPLAAILRAKVGSKVEIIYNGFSPDDYGNLPLDRIFPIDGIFRIVYTGTIYSGKQDPTPLFRAICLLHNQGLISPAHLQVVTAGHNADVSGIAHSEGISAYVQYAGFVPRQDALRMQRDADALLFLEFEAPGVEGILTGKLFEYLFATPPIIAVGIGGKSDAGHIIEDTGRGRSYGKDVELLADSLTHLLRSGQWQRKNKENMLTQDIQRFSRSEQAARLLSFVVRE